PAKVPLIPMTARYLPVTSRKKPLGLNEHRTGRPGDAPHTSLSSTLREDPPQAIKNKASHSFLRAFRGRCCIKITPGAGVPGVRSPGPTLVKFLLTTRACRAPVGSHD